MPEKHISARADLFKSYARRAVLGTGALALALTAVDVAPDTSTNNEISAVAPVTISSDETGGVISLADNEFAEQRQQKRASRSVERKPITEPYCWYGTPAEIQRATGGDKIMTKKRMANIAMACAMAVGQNWYTDNYKTEIQSLVKLWDKESGWKVDDAYGNAYGIPQALPGKKMAKAGTDWRTNPKTQIEWGFGYIEQRYKSPQKAWNHFQSNNWY